MRYNSPARQNAQVLYGLLAQLGERMGHNHDVAGSSPSQTTNDKAGTSVIGSAGFLFRHIFRFEKGKREVTYHREKALVPSDRRPRDRFRSDK